MTRGIALVTGGGTGIGAACCKSLASEGFIVAVHYNRSHQGAEKIVAEIQANGGQAFTIQGDISSIEAIDTMLKTLSEREEKVEVLVNNAGAAWDGLIFSSSAEDFDATINTNLKSAWYLIKKVGRMMMRKKAGRIVNISSVIGSTGNIGQALYGMSKAAMDNLTHTAALEFAAYNILVNSVAPGFIDTDMTRELPEEAKEAIMQKVPLQRMGATDEIADMVTFLCTKGSYCTGNIFHVNGGMYGG